MFDTSDTSMRLLSSGKIIGLPGITDELKKIAEGSERLYAAVAYVTIIPSSLQKVLKEGFLCVDVHSPTSVETLTTADGNSIPVFLHLKKVVPKIESRGYNHLLHSKLLLFESDDKATIIIGSHNWTSRAIPGANIEDSIIIEVPVDHELHTSVKEHLIRIKDSCHAFDLKDVPLYKAIQDNYKNKAKYTVTILRDGKNIPLDSDIVIFGNNFEDYAKVKSIDEDEVIIHIQEKSNPLDVQTYDADIIRSGSLPKSDPKTKPEDFFPVYQATWKTGSKIPEITGHGVPLGSVNDNYNYFIHLRIGSRTNAQLVHPLNIPAIWEKTDETIDFSNDEVFCDKRTKEVRIYNARVDNFAEEWEMEKNHKKVQPEEFEFVGKYVVQNDGEQ